ncbi:steroid 17-alpha-hydroxylase/17,20 lyase-like [Diadema antillarum]|uniref:steroid 17-alpha-hydroxylase/17,20 lyase-like n=1 Tax=Diadema antillarum TaxID=105358 RepID=UPI003A88D1DA
MIDFLGTLTESSLGQVNGLTITATLGVLLVSMAIWSVSRPSKFPPGPRGLPIVGSIYDMNDSPEVVFGKWAKKYGDIFGLKIGQRWMVVLNRKDIIKEAVIKQGVEFAGRPDFYTFDVFTDGFKDIAFSTYSDTWKLHRKLGHTALRHFATGKPLQKLVSSVYPKVEKELAENDGKPIDPRLLLTLIMFNVLSQMCFGKSYALHDPKVKEWMQVNDKLNAQFGLGLAADFFSWAKYVPTSGPRRIKEITEEFENIIKTELDQHKKQTYDPDNISDFYSMLLKTQEDARRAGENVDKLTDVHIVQTLLDIFGAGTQTTIETLYWALALMSENPGIQKKAQAEIDSVVGRDRVPTIEDRGTLPYTEATLYEVMRYSTIVPTSLPHSTMCDTKIRDYIIPKDAVVIMNTHSMHFDPQEWDDPHSFKPEHFLDGAGTVRQHPPSFMPFGAGRRSCLGEAVAKADLFLIFSWFLQNYTFSKIPGKESESLINLIPKTAAGRLLTSYKIVISERK